ERPERRPVFDGLELQGLVTRDDDGAGNRRQVSRLAALLVVLNELVDLSTDDCPLVSLFARCDAPLEQIPVHLRWCRDLLASAPDRLRLLAVIEHLEPDELVYVVR